MSESDDDLIRLHCGFCDVAFGMTRRMRDQRKRDGETWWCPNGHQRVWSETEETKLRRERDLLKQQMARVEEEKRAAWATANAQLERAHKAEAETKRVKRRAVAATCPCCNRSFANVARHMRTKHPDVLPLPAHVAKARVRSDPAT